MSHQQLLYIHRVHATRTSTTEAHCEIVHNFFPLIFQYLKCLKIWFLSFKIWLLSFKWLLNFKVKLNFLTFFASGTAMSNTVIDTIFLNRKKYGFPHSVYWRWGKNSNAQSLILIRSPILFSFLSHLQLLSDTNRLLKPLQMTDNLSIAEILQLQYVLSWFEDNLRISSDFC